MTTFFGDEDYAEYIDLMAEWCLKFGVDVWAYCLMQNHVHLIYVPSSDESLRQAIGKAHRRYSPMINFRENWRGHLWQGLFASFPMDENYLFCAARYVGMNPVRAHLVQDAASSPWSSTRAYLIGQDDYLVKTDPLLEIAGDWRLFLNSEIDIAKMNEIGTHERTGRTLGLKNFIEKLESVLDRPLKRGKPGPKVNN